MRLVWLVPVMLMAAAPASGQAGADRGLRFMASLGYEVGGSGESLSVALAELGLDQTRPRRCVAANVCQDAIDYPVVGGDAFNVVVALGVRYRFRAPFSLELRLSNAVRGFAEGYNHETRDHLLLTYAPFVLAGTIGWHLGPVRVAVGPAVNRTSWNATLNSAREMATDATVPGVVGEVSAAFQVAEAQLEVSAHAHRFGAASVRAPEYGPIEARYDGIVFGIKMLTGS